MKREKVKQDRERHLKRIEEHREQQEELKRKKDEEILKQQLAEAHSKTRMADNPPTKHSDVKKYFEKLLGSAGHKIPVVATPKIALPYTLTNSDNETDSDKTSRYSILQCVCVWCLVHNKL